MAAPFIGWRGFEEAVDPPTPEEVARMQVDLARQFPNLEWPARPEEQAPVVSHIWFNRIEDPPARMAVAPPEEENP